MKVFAFLGFILWALYISDRDLRSFRISNWGLVLFLIFGYPMFWLAGIDPELSQIKVVTAGIILMVALKGWIGMGDAKLLILLIPLFEFADWESSLVLLLVISVIQIAYLSLRKREIVPAIAWAPAILLTYTFNMASQFRFF